MSEVKQYGPMDSVREILANAEVLDEITAEATHRVYYSTKDDQELRDINEAALELDDELSMYGLIGAQVTVSGQALTMSTDEMGEYRALTMPTYGKEMSVTGTYHGFSIRTVSELDGDHCTYRLTHAIHTGTLQYENSIGHPIQQSEVTYICATGASIEPILPINAHSLIDLGNDPLLKVIEQTLLDSSMPDPQKVRYIGAKATRFVIGHEEEPELNHQRVSYINETGVFLGTEISANEVVIAPDRQSFLRQDKDACCFLSAQTIIAPEYIDIMPGYTFMPDGEILPFGPPELYATVETDEGNYYVPLRSVIGIGFRDERAAA